ncbi:putative membrane protein [Catalinimonas alkaloidigena]|uniref:Putative membrane protein n=1 Tax=Catalinimonas alkaloidigena TaxID=1075417 RepID=A0A1G9AIU7_9BACT|nr:bestrophin family ion channel [Catalinimonas alkaloidigena]SDK27163.1 putative membrane protein [Catalinimonas alkaloidigena]
MLLKKHIPISYVFGKIKYEMIFVSIYAVIIGILDEDFHEDISVPLSVPMILGTAISLLLAFRSNQAYDRWWEARIIWGAIVNDSRSLTRQALTFVHDPTFSVEVLRWQEQFVKRQMAWCHSLGQALRGLDPIGRCRSLLSAEDLHFIEQHDNKPNALLLLHGRDIRRWLDEGLINAYQHVQLDETLTKLCDSMGKCERIKNTVFPTTYSLYLHLSLYFFVMLLPFGLVDYFGLIEIPLVIAIAAAFFLIEKMAVHLQDPFENKPTDTPVTTIANTIERNLRQMLDDQRPQTTPEVQTYYQM